MASALRNRLMRLAPSIILFAAILFATAVRIRLLQIPLERDEGEYAYAGQLLLQGVPPYKVAFNMKFPGVYGAYALIMAIFGETIGGIHLGFLLWNAGTVILVALLGKRLFGSAAGAASGAAYAIMTLGLGIYGLEAHATHFVVLPVVGACLLLLRSLETGRFLELFSSGILIGISVLMKQHGLLFAALGPLWLFLDHRKSHHDSWRPMLRKLLVFSAGICVPIAATCMALWASGVFDRFWFWTFTYAREYVSLTPLSIGWKNFTDAFPEVVAGNVLIWIFAAGALVTLWRKQDRASGAFVTLLLVFSFLAICPGLYFRPHYFVLMLPAVALLAGAGFAAIRRLAGSTIAVALYSAALLLPVFEQRQWFFSASPVQIARHMYSNNPFPESIPIADQIRNRTTESASIAVLASEPQIYFYARRRGATGYIYMYPLMEAQPYALIMQKDMTREIESNRPEYIVLGTGAATWSMQAGSSRYLLDWWNTYNQQHYEKVGIAELRPSGESVYRWGRIDSYDTQSDPVLIVFHRKD